MAKSEKSLEKKEEENKEIPGSAKVERKNNQIFWIIGMILFLVVVFSISYYIFSSYRSFEYTGLTFTREKFGEIPVFHYYYYITPELKYNLYLRNDPRENNVPVTGKIIDNGIEFSKDERVYLSVDPKGLTECEYGRVGIGSLASFLADNQLNVKGAAPDEKLAKEANVNYATCEFRPDDVVIILKEGEQTRIVHDKDKCYVIEVANCEIMPAVEKFQVQAVLDARARRLANTKSSGD